MFIDQLRASVETAPRSDFARLWKTISAAFGENTITEADYLALGGVLTARQELPPKPRPEPKISRAGSRPRTPESLDRRRQWIASGLLPRAIAAKFTAGEQAALAVIALDCAERGSCTRFIDHIAAVAGVCRSTVKNAQRVAVSEGLIVVTERRRSAWYNDSNKVQVVSQEWLTWLKIRGRHAEGRRRRRGRHRDSGVKSLPTTGTEIIGGVALRRDKVPKCAPTARGVGENLLPTRETNHPGAAGGQPARSMPPDSPPKAGRSGIRGG